MNTTNCRTIAIVIFWLTVAITIFHMVKYKSTGEILTTVAVKVEQLNVELIEATENKDGCGICASKGGLKAIEELVEGF